MIHRRLSATPTYRDEGHLFHRHPQQCRPSCIGLGDIDESHFVRKKWPLLAKRDDVAGLCGSNRVPTGLASAKRANAQKFDRSQKKKSPSLAIRVPWSFLMARRALLWALGGLSLFWRGRKDESRRRGNTCPDKGGAHTSSYLQNFGLGCFVLPLVLESGTCRAIAITGAVEVAARLLFANRTDTAE